MSFNYNNLDTPTKSYLCHEKLEATQLDNSLYNPLLNVIEKLNSIGNYIRSNEDSWSSEGLSEGGDTLEFPLSAINGLQTSSTNKILYYNNDGNWEYKDYKELKFPLSELYDLTSDNLDLDGTKWVLVYDLETLNDRGWKFLPYNTGTGSGLILGKVAYDLNTVNNPNTNVKQILVWDNDGNGTWKWLIENYTSTSPTTGLTWTDLTNPGNEKIHSSHLPSSWWGRSISNNIVEGNLSGNIQYIKFDSGGHTVYLGLDSDGNLRVSKSENGNDGSSGANFYATGGVSALGNSSSSGGGGTTPGETSLKSLLNNVNDLGTNYSNPSTGYTIVYNNGSWIDRKLDLSELGDVSINDVSNNDVLTYNGTNWVNSPALSVVSSLELLSDVEDDVSNIKALNVIQPSGSILSYSYPLTLLVGSTSDTSSNIYNSEVTWKLYVFLLETDSTAAHLISGGSLTSNTGIVTRLNFGLAGSPMNNYRFPTYITGVRLQSSDMTRYHITGTKHIKDKTINNNNQTWDLDYDETFCSDKVYIINNELYSNANKVLTTDSTLLSSKLDNNSITVNNTSILLGGSGTVTAYWPAAKSFTVKNTSGDSISNSPTTNGSSNIDIQLNKNANLGNVNISGNAATASRLIGDDTYTAWGRTYWLNGTPNSISGDLDYVRTIRFNYNNGSDLYLTESKNVYPDTNLVSDDLHLTRVLKYESPRIEQCYFKFESKISGEAGSTNDKREAVFSMLDRNIIDYEPNHTTSNNVLNPTLSIGYGTRTDASLQLSGKDMVFYIYNNSSRDVVRLTSDLQTYLPQATQASSGLRIGDAILYWDNSNGNNSLALVKSDGTACNFYATGGVSALGLSPNSGSGSVPAMTFGNLTVNNQLKMGEDVTLLNNDNWLIINGVEGVEINNELQIDGNITCSGVTLDDNVTLLYEDPELILRIGNTSYKITKTVIQG